MTAPLLEVRGLKLAFDSAHGPLEALRGVDLAVARGECLGLVGESGSGKSVTALAVMRLLATPPARILAGTATLDGQDLLALPRDELNRTRGRRIAMIFQEPMSALNPVLRVGDQIIGPLRRHMGLDRRAARERATELLDLVGIADPRARLDAFPHQLSGGMRQRVMIAMALACEPQVLIADEPTTALDVTIQAQILDLLRKLRAELGLAVIIITHDLGVVAELADRVAVMYGGRVVEEAPVEALFDQPLHPYAQGLLRATPILEAPLQRRLPTIGGAVPHLRDMPQGCAFHPRCPLRRERCEQEPPPLVEAVPGHAVACWAVA